MWDFPFKWSNVQTNLRMLGHPTSFPHQKLVGVGAESTSKLIHTTAWDYCVQPFIMQYHISVYVTEERWCHKLIPLAVGGNQRCCKEPQEWGWEHCCDFCINPDLICFNVSWATPVMRFLSQLRMRGGALTVFIVHLGQHYNIAIYVA